VNPDTGRCVKVDGRIGKKILYGNLNIKPVPGFESPPRFHGVVRKARDRRWVKKHLIGEGGYGQVYVICWYDDCEYVVKVQPEDPEFYNEVKFLNFLKYYIFTPVIYDAWVNDGKGYLVMNKMDKTTNKLSKRQKHTELKQILKRLHKNKIVFFDLHPGNVMYKGGDVRLIDWGLAYRFKNSGEEIEHLHSRDYGPFNLAKGKKLDMLNLDEYWGTKVQKKKAQKELGDMLID
jgi:serine/threonine protein kinase